MRFVQLFVACSLALAACVQTSVASTIDLAIDPRPGADSGDALLRLVPMPPGADAAEVRLVDDDPSVEVKALEPMIMRGVRLLPIVIAPAGAKARPDGALDGRAVAQLPPRVNLRIEFSTGKGWEAPASNARQHARGFYRLIEPLLAGADKAQLGGDREGSYLIISSPEYLSAVEPIATWKREKGLNVQLVSTLETGVDRNQIRAYINNLYRNAPVPPQYVLLIGDIDDVPAFDFHGIVSDHQYAMQEGDDFLPDLYVGRLSASNESELRSIVAKVLRHERDPFRAEGPNGGAWMGRGLVVGADYASTTPVECSRWIRREMLESGWSQVDSVYFPPHHGSGTPLISARVNQGVSLVTYRGWAYGSQGWDRPTFLNNHVSSLNNGWMLPVVMSFVCLNNKFDDPECFGESWLRAGTADEPRGGVAFIGNGEHWSHTRFNDGAAIGAVEVIERDGVRRLGDLLHASKAFLLRQFPLEIPYESEAGESVEFYYYIYNLLGDPEMELWAGAPREIEVDHAAVIPAGGNLLEVRVTEGGGVPVEGARVAATQGATLLGCAWTDADGRVVIPAEFAEAGGTVRVTVTGVNVLPYRGTAEVAPVAGFVRLEAVSILDDGTEGTSGNGNGRPNPGETLSLRVTLRNESDVAVPAGSATLEATGVIPVLQSQGDFAGLAPRSTVVVSPHFQVAVPAQAENGTEATFRLAVAAGGVGSPSDLRFVIEAPRLQYVRHLVTGEALPGESIGLAVTIQNEGVIPASEVTAELSAVESGLVTILESTAGYGSLAAGASATGDAAFSLQIDESIPLGQVVNLRLAFQTAEGYDSEIVFAVPVGAADHTAPLGAGQYGYWIYDNSDTDYPDTAPLYDWVEISPTFGGSGTPLVLDDNLNDDNDPNGTAVVNLPFTFRFYGRDYSQLKVADNGWVSFDTRRAYDFYNWSLPSTYGNLARLAVFWDNLAPGKRDAQGRLVGDGVYFWHDEANHRFIVEWSRIGNTDQPATPPSPSRFFNDLQTFQVILHDPAHYPTTSGDGVVLYQYKQVANVDYGRMYASVGLENEHGDDGIEYTYSNVYPPQAAPLSPGLALRLTTQPPRFVPFRLAEFRAEASSPGVTLSWTPIDERPRAGWQVFRAGDDGRFVPVSAVPLEGHVRGFVDSSADAGRAWQYRIGSTDPVGRETLLGPFHYEPSAGSAEVSTFALKLIGTNPVRGGAQLAYSLRQPGDARLVIHDVTGRVVRTMLAGPAKARQDVMRWDGRDDAGRLLPAGVYLARLSTRGEEQSVKLTLIR